MRLTRAPARRTTPARGLCAITRPTRFEAARRRRTAPTPQRLERIFAFALASFSPITRGTRHLGGGEGGGGGGGGAEVAEAEVVEAEAAVVGAVVVEEEEAAAAEVRRSSR